MPIITISRGSYNHGKSIAEKLAAKLGYSCLSRDQVLEDLEEFHLPEIKLVRGLNDAFSVLDRFPHGKQRFTAAIRSAILQQFRRGNVVYHGLVGHYFVKDISHVLKVRIIADIDRRVADEVAREKISEEQARFILKKDDEERRKWAMFLYGIDVNHADNYNLVIRIGHLKEDEAVDIIANAVSLPAFQETPESQMALDEEAVVTLVRHKLFDFPHASVSAQNGEVKIAMKIPEGQQPLIETRVAELLTDAEGLKNYTLHFEPYF